MGDCNETLRELEQFLDDELSGDAHDAIHAHLEGCTDCLEAFDFHAELRQLIAVKCRNDELPPGLLARIERCFGDEA
jgi:anti-sigma factor (TIGR02949 family)